MKTFVEKLEQCWNSSDVVASLREENAWGVDGTVPVTGRLHPRGRRDCRVWVQRPVPRSTPPLVFSHLGQERTVHWLDQFYSPRRKNASSPILTLFLSVRSTGGGRLRKTRSKAPKRLMRDCIFCHDLFDINPKFRSFVRNQLEGDRDYWDCLSVSFMT